MNGAAGCRSSDVPRRARKAPIKWGPLTPADVAIPLITAVAGLVTGVATTSWRARTELAARYDADLRTERLKAYRDLWKRLECLASYPTPAAVTSGTVAELAVDLREWYYREGGIFMSRQSQRAFVRLQQAIGASTSQRDEREADPPLSQDQVDQIRKCASFLRTWTTRDILSRRGSLLTVQRFAR